MIAVLHRELRVGGWGDPGAVHVHPAPNPSLPFDLFRPFLVMISKVSGTVPGHPPDHHLLHYFPDWNHWKRVHVHCDC